MYNDKALYLHIRVYTRMYTRTYIPILGMFILDMHDLSYILFYVAFVAKIRTVIIGCFVQVQRGNKRNDMS